MSLQYLSAEVEAHSVMQQNNILEAYYWLFSPSAAWWRPDPSRPSRLPPPHAPHILAGQAATHLLRKQSEKATCEVHLDVNISAGQTTPREGLGAGAPRLSSRLLYDASGSRACFFLSTSPPACPARQGSARGPASYFKGGLRRWLIRSFFFI